MYIVHLLEEELSIHSEEMVEDINNEELDVVLDSGHESPNIDEEVCNKITTCTYTGV